MKNFQSGLIKGWMLFFTFLLLWCVLTSAQTNNTAPASSNSEVVGPPVPEARSSLSFGLDRISELNYRILDIPLWQYLASALYLVLAVIAARIFDYLLAIQLKRFANRTKTPLDDLIIDLLRGPVKALALVLLLHLGINLFQWPLWLENWLKKGLYVLLACSLTYMLIKVVDLAATYWKNRPAIKADKTFSELLIPLLSKTAKGFIIIMAILVTLDNLDFNIRTLLAGVSVGGLALGLAAQDTVGNLFGAAAVFVDKPFQIGDRVQLNGIDGTVEEIGLRSTRIRNLDGHLITVPNKTMGNATITNITRRPNIKTVMNIGITYDTTAEKVEQAISILNEIYGKNPMTHDVVIGFNQFADSSLNILVVHWWKGLVHKDYVAGLQEMNLEVKRRFDAAGISFAFPSRTVYLKQDGDWRLAPAKDGPEGAVAS
jgi:MscS family membrane protein